MEPGKDIEEEWVLSFEYTHAYALWLRYRSHDKFENSREFADGRWAFRKRVNGGGDGNDG